jgi:hypothetical protein
MDTDQEEKAATGASFKTVAADACRVIALVRRPVRRLHILGNP